MSMLKLGGVVDVQDPDKSFYEEVDGGKSHLRGEMNWYSQTPKFQEGGPFYCSVIEIHSTKWTDEIDI